MRYSIGLILLASCTSGQATAYPGEQKWSAQMDDPVLAAPAIAPNGTVYAGAGNALFVIPARSNESISHNRERKLLHQFTGLLVTSLAVSPGGHYLYATYYKPRKCSYPDTSESCADAAFNIFSLKHSNSAELIWSYPENNTFFSAPTVDEAGNIYVRTTFKSSEQYEGMPGLLKISGDEIPPVITKMHFSFVATRNSTTQRNLGPVVYNNEGAAVIGYAGVFKYPYLFYTSFEKVLPPPPFFTLDYYTYYGWGSLLPPNILYSEPAINDAVNNTDARGEIYLATSNGYLEAYQSSSYVYGVPRKWHHQLSDSDNDLSKSTLVVGKDGTVYIGDSITGVLYAYNRENKINWSLKLSPYGITRPPVVDSKNGLVYVVDDNGGLFAINALKKGGKGALVWKHKNIHAITAPVVGLDGTVIVGTANNKVIAYKMAL